MHLSSSSSSEDCRLFNCVFHKKNVQRENSQTESDRLEFDLKCKDERKCVRSCNRQHQTRRLRRVIACFRREAAGNRSVSRSVNPKSLLTRGSSARVCPDPPRRDLPGQTVTSALINCSRQGCEIPRFPHFQGLNSVMNKSQRPVN